MRKFVYAIALVALSISSCQDLTIERSNNSTIKIGKVSIVNSSFKTKVSSGTNVTTEGEVIVEESIEASETPLTKASEIVSLGDFYLEGYLDRSIENKVAASYDDKTNPHFINKALVSKGDNGWSIAGAPTWRNMVEHYFWAYAGSEIELSPVVDKDYTKMSFSYNSQENDGDLIVAYTSQGGNVDHSDHVADAKDNYIESLVFNHALAEIVLDCNGITAERPIWDKDQKKYVLQDASADLQINPSFAKIYYYAEATVDSASINWSVDADKFSLLDVKFDEPYFVLPQGKPAAIELNLVDTKTNKSWFDVATIKPGDWNNGNRYRYSLSKNIEMPVYATDDDNNILGMGFAANGKEKVTELIGNLQSNYIKSIDIDWFGVPFSSTGSGTYLVFYIAPEKIDIADNDIARKMIENPNPDNNSYKVVFGCAIGSNKLPGGWISSLDSVTKPADEAKAANTHVIIKGFELPEVWEKCNLYAYYGGATQGKQGNDNNLAFTNLTVSINERRY